MQGGGPYNEKKGPAAVIKVTRPSTWQKDFITNCKEYARMVFPKYVNVHRGRVVNKAEVCVVVRSLENFRRRAVDEMVTAGNRDVGKGRHYQSRTRKSAEEL